MTTGNSVPGHDMRRAGPSGARRYLVVAQDIRQLVRERALAPGARLPSERALAATLAVSRSVLREALVALELAGEVRVEGGSGIYLAAGQPRPQPAAPGAEPATPREVLAARRLVACEVAAHAARHASDAAADRILRCLTEIENAGACGLKQEYAFMRAIAQACCNSALVGVVEHLWRHDAAPAAQPIPAPSPASPGYRRALLAAIVERDALAARRAMRAHLDWLAPARQAAGAELPPDN